MTTTTDQLRHKLRNVATGHLGALKTGLLKAAILLQRESLKIVPVEHGDLKASSFIEVLSSDRLRPEIAVGYSDPKAVVVHENLSNAHGEEYNVKHAAAIAAGRDFARGPNQTAKFLERPARETSKARSVIVRQEINNASKQKS